MSDASAATPDPISDLKKTVTDTQAQIAGLAGQLKQQAESDQAKAVDGLHARIAAVETTVTNALSAELAKLQQSRRAFGAALVIAALVGAIILGLPIGFMFGRH